MADKFQVLPKWMFYGLERARSPNFCTQRKVSAAFEESDRSHRKSTAHLKERAAGLLNAWLPLNWIQRQERKAAVSLSWRRSSLTAVTEQGLGAFLFRKIMVDRARPYEVQSKECLHAARGARRIHNINLGRKKEPPEGSYWSWKYYYSAW